MGRGGKKSKTKEQFIEDAKKVHKDKYDYSKSEYTNCKNKITIICPNHGEFKQTPDNHLQKKGCVLCEKDKSLTSRSINFVKKATIIHDNKFNYSLVNYINNTIKVDIICPTHGIFQQTPLNHIQGNGCSKCRSENQSEKVEKFKNFVYSSNKKHNNKYLYNIDDFTNLVNPTKIICPTHGEFLMIPHRHSKGAGCKKCSNISSGLSIRSNTQDFIKKSKEVHGDKYDYSTTKYVHSREKVDIGCSIHGIFKQVPSTHLKGSGCQKCATLVNVYKKEDYIKLSKTATVYVVLMEHEDEKFIKIGKTKNTVKERLSNNISVYTYKILYEKEQSSSVTFDLEIELHKMYCNYKYLPNHCFAGRTECYSTILPVEHVYKTIENYGQ